MFFWGAVCSHPGLAKITVDPEQNEQIRKYLETQPDCRKALGALDRVISGKIADPNFQRLTWPEYSRYQRDLIQVQMHLYNAVKSLRLRSRLWVAMARTELDFRASNYEDALSTNLGSAQSSIVPLHLKFTANTRNRTHATFEALFSALKIQADLSLEHASDPVHSNKHLSPEAKTWVWQFDRERDQSTAFFRPKAKETIKPLSDNFFTDIESGTLIESAHSEKILTWFDSQALIHGLVDETGLRMLRRGPEFLGLVQLLHALGIREHPFTAPAESNSQTVRDFLNGDSSAVDHSDPITDLKTEFNKALNEDRYEDAKNILQQIDLIFDRSLSQGDYFPLEPLVVIALRAAVIEALQNPEARLLKPRRNRDGTFILAFDAFQIHIFENNQGEIETLKFGFKTADTLIHLFKKRKIGPQKTNSTPVPRPQPTEIQSVEPRDLEEFENPEEVQELDLQSLNLPTEIASDLNQINQDRPGHHDFLTEAAQLLFEFPEFMDTRGMGWFLSKVRQRTYMNERAGLEQAIDRLREDIENYFESHYRFDDAIARVEESGTELKGQFELGRFLNGDTIAELEAETKYQFSFRGESIARWVSFSPEVAKFLKDSNNNGIQFIRAILRGPVATRSVSGIVKLSASDSLGYDFEIRVIRKGRHDRLVVQVRPDRSWAVTKVVTDLNKN